MYTIFYVNLVKIDQKKKNNFNKRVCIFFILTQINKVIKIEMI